MNPDQGEKMDAFNVLFSVLVIMLLVPILVIPAKIFNASVRGIYKSFVKTFRTISG
jgi:hypothetical protein